MRYQQTKGCRPPNWTASAWGFKGFQAKCQPNPTPPPPHPPNKPHQTQIVPTKSLSAPPRSVQQGSLQNCHARLNEGQVTDKIRLQNFNPGHRCQCKSRCSLKYLRQMQFYDIFLERRVNQKHAHKPGVPVFPQTRVPTCNLQSGIHGMSGLSDVGMPS